MYILLKKGRRNIATVVITQEGVIFDLTGYEAEIVVASSPGAIPEVHMAGIISAPATGKVVFTILPADLVNADEGHFRYEVNVWKTDDPTIMFTPVEGLVEIKRGLDENPAV